MKKLGKYEVIDLLGSGATAEVYRARDTVLGREVALKLLRPALVTDVSAFNRFLQEAQAAAGLFHPNIATVLDTGEDEGRYFIAMRYIPGRSLDHIIQQDGPQPLDDVIKMLHQVGSALDFAHNQGFMHRDVKPANIIRSERGDYVLTDFGLVRAMMTTGLTSHTGAVLGTPAYIPPEIWLNQTATPAVDQYALACVAYEMLTGEVLFTGDTPPAVMTAHVLNGVGSLAALPTVLSEPLRKALSQKPQERFSSIAEFLEVLDKKAPFAQPTLQDGMATRPQEPIDTHKDRRASDIPGPAAEPPSHIQHGTAPAKTDAMEKLEREGKLLQTVPAEKVAATNHFQADQTGQQINPKTAELATNPQMTALPAGNSPVASVDSGSVSHAPGNASPGKPGTGARKGRISGWVYGLFGLAGLAILIICILIALPSLIKPVSDAPTPSPSATPVPVSGFHQPRTDPVKVCLVTDTGGIDDKSFNATTWAGVQEAIEVYGVDGKYVESQEFADYEKNISLFLEEDCDLIIPVGFMLADATRAAAEANPAAKFSIVDVSYDPIVPNILGQVFQTDEAAFLAGYLAAGMTKTGKIGTYGGFPIPTVTIFMDGLARGVAYYNEVHGTDVKVIGWDINNPDAGLFSSSFDDQDKGRELGVSLMDEGCDIIMPVAGPVGLGTAAVLKERGGYLIGVDSDWFLTSPDYADIVLTSVLKNMNVTVLDSVKMVIDDTFAGGTTVGTLANRGVGLAPFHNLDGFIPLELKTELDQVKQGIIAGTINTR